MNKYGVAGSPISGYRLRKPTMSTIATCHLSCCRRQHCVDTYHEIPAAPSIPATRYCMPTTLRYSHWGKCGGCAKRTASVRLAPISA
jgi:hypothetical protein